MTVSFKGELKTDKRSYRAPEGTEGWMTAKAAWTKGKGNAAGADPDHGLNSRLEEPARSMHANLHNMGG